MFSGGLYIFWFLHQTTTQHCRLQPQDCCISFDSYIKPQLLLICGVITSRCISFDSYIKPQLRKLRKSSCSRCISFDSYIKPQHNVNRDTLPTCCISFDSYIKPQLTIFSCIGFGVVYLLIPTSNHNSVGYDMDEFLLYIFWFLHQTTTLILFLRFLRRCISFDSYIKPQPPVLVMIIL